MLWEIGGSEIIQETVKLIERNVLWVAIPLEHRIELTPALGLTRTADLLPAVVQGHHGRGWLHRRTRKIRRPLTEQHIVILGAKVNVHSGVHRGRRRQFTVEFTFLQACGGLCKLLLVLFERRRDTAMVAAVLTAVRGVGPGQAVACGE